jgi:hypothetical protein
VRGKVNLGTGVNRDEGNAQVKRPAQLTSLALLLALAQPAVAYHDELNCFFAGFGKTIGFAAGMALVTTPIIATVIDRIEVSDAATGAVVGVAIAGISGGAYAAAKCDNADNATLVLIAVAGGIGGPLLFGILRGDTQNRVGMTQGRPATGFRVWPDPTLPRIGYSIRF